MQNVHFLQQLKIPFQMEFNKALSYLKHTVTPQFVNRYHVIYLTVWLQVVQ